MIKWSHIRCDRFNHDARLNSSIHITTIWLWKLNFRSIALFNNIETFVYFFMNKFFAQHHRFSLISLIYSRRFRDFNDQIALIENIIYVIEVIMIVKDHIERLFFYVTNLNQYFIIMSFFWLRRHDIDVNFEFNTFIMFSFFCLIDCCFNSIKIFEVTREEENFLFLKVSTYMRTRKSKSFI